MEAVRAAALDVAAGEHELVLAVGAEKMRDVTSRGSLVARTANLTHPTVAKGRTAPGQFALLANAYMERWGIVARDARTGGGQEPRARDPQPEGALPLADHRRGRARRPARGGAVRHARLHADDRRRRRRRARLGGVGARATPSTSSSSAASALPSPRATTRPSSTRRTTSSASARRARRRPSRTGRPGSRDPRGQLDLVECHDCFTVTELVNTEDLGLCGRGEGGALLESGATAFGGDIPVNVSGGLQSCGHPVGATGVRMIAEIGDHILGRAGERQVEGARLGARPHARRPRRRVDGLRRGRRRVSSLEERLQRLEDERAILDRLYAYCYSLDYGWRDEWLDCWTEDAVLAWPHETFTGRDDDRTGVRRPLARARRRSTST